MIAEVTSLKTWEDSMKHVGLQFEVRRDRLIEYKEHDKNVCQTLWMPTRVLTKPSLNWKNIFIWIKDAASK